jgi:hypothetical protein
LIVVVVAARKLSDAAESTNAVAGAAGDGGACGSGNTMCSPVHTESYPLSSHAWATAAIVDGSLITPKFMPNMPIRGRLITPDCYPNAPVVPKLVS